jgi:suppressor of tumorigenicity protein 13
MSDTQWTLKVHIKSIDYEGVKGKCKWNKGDNLTLQIEGHATVNMLKQRVALIVCAHPKHQFISYQDKVLEDIVKLEEIEGFGNGSTINLDVKIPPEPEVPPVVLSDDEGLFTGEEVAPPEMPSQDVISKELSDADMDKQCELKQAAQDALEDGDLEKAVAKFTEAMMLGSCSAMMVAKRADMLLKQKRYKAVVADATLALSLNPDSAKGYRARGKARRFLGEYEGSCADLAQAQNIDYDDGVADLHKYVQKRWEKIQLKAKQDAKAAAKAAKEAEAA